MSDGMLVEFASAGEEVEAALDLQRRFAASNEGCSAIFDKEREQ
jgi:hypothetical protein